jgi:hypothetical protein
METTAFATLTQRSLANHAHISRKGGKTMKKLLKGLMALTVTIGLSTSAHADGWRRVSSGNGNPITGIVAWSDSVTILEVVNNGCGGGAIRFYPGGPHYDMAVLLINRASIEDKRLDIWVTCQGTDAQGGAVIFLQ